MFEGVKTKVPLLFPILEPNYVVERIMEGILSNDAYVFLPEATRLTYLMKFMLPTAITDKIFDLLGITSSMEEFVGRK